MNWYNIISKLLFAIVIIIPSFASAQTIVGNLISSSATWTSSGNPYIVPGNSLVDIGVTLTIDSGVIIKFDAAASLQIRGTLRAQGTPTNHIVFTSNQATPSPGDWNYILFWNDAEDYDTLSNTGSFLKYSIIEYAGSNILNGAVQTDESSPWIDHCIIQNNAAAGILIFNPTSSVPEIKITENQILNNNRGALQIEAMFKIARNLIYRNQLGGGTSEPIYLDYMGVFENNIVVNNSGMGILNTEGANTGSSIFIKNHFIDNISSISNGLYPDAIIRTSLTSAETFTENTLVRNQFGSHPFSTIEYRNQFNHDCFTSTYSYNNIYGNQSILNYSVEFNNDSPLGSLDIDASNNWWHTTQNTDVDSLIVDWFDNGNSGITIYSPVQNGPVVEAPVTPPAAVWKTDLGGGSVKVSWIPNLETDLAGYKIYWGNFTGYSFTNSIDAGNVNSYTLNGMNYTDTIGVTAYDLDADDFEDQLDANESWFTYAEDSTAVSNSTPSQDELYVVAFPNPAVDKTILSFSQVPGFNARINIVDVYGSVVKELGKVSGKEVVCERGSLASGIYFFHVEINKKIISTGKIIFY